MRPVRTPLEGLWEIETTAHRDPRGRFTRLFCADTLSSVRSDLRFVQVNHSVTLGRGTVRGLHFQRAPAADAKLVCCLRGRVYDVAVDLRKGSPTFGRWHSVELDPQTEREFFIPEGFAHGFQALSEEVELLYQHTAPYAPALEGGLRHDDPALCIRWPLPACNLSHRDQSHPLLDSQFEGIAL